MLLQVRSGRPGRLPSPSVGDYIFTMIRASKSYGADRNILEDITLAFLPGAKIALCSPQAHHICLV